MRYYVLCFSQVPEIAPFIVGEVVRDHVDTGREYSIAGAIAGPRAMILTRDELVADPVGREALEAWDSHDDTAFERETVALSGDDDVVWSDLKLVTDDAGPQQRKPRALFLPDDPVRRNLISQARGLRVVARTIVQQSRARRAEMAARRRPGRHLVGVDHD